MNVQRNDGQVLWAERYRPRQIADVILPRSTKQQFQSFVDNRNVPNLLLSGVSGVGKTTAAKAILDQLECDYTVINGSLNMGLDALRTNVQIFASSRSFSGNRKYVVIDEADGLSKQVQDGLRNFIDEFSSNCGFIFTCNYLNKITDAIRSRTSHVDFAIDKTERQRMAAQFYKRVTHILQQENVEFQPEVVVQLIEKHFPDFRRMLNELQKYSASGSIDSGILTSLTEQSIERLFEILKAGKFTEMRTWVAENTDVDSATIFRAIFDVAVEKIEMKSIPAVVVMLADYQYKHAFVADPEINMTAFLSEVMVEASFR